MQKKNETGEKFAVVYLWQGERHRLLQDFESIESARLAIAELVKSGFRAWAEGL